MSRRSLRGKLELSAAGYYDQPEPEDFEQVEELVQTQARLAVFDRMDETLGTARELREICLSQAELRASPTYGLREPIQSFCHLRGVWV